MSLDGDIWLSILNEEKNKKSKEVILKGLAKSDDDKVKNSESTKEVLNRLQCLYCGDSHVAQEEFEEHCCSNNESEVGEVFAHHTLSGD